MTALAHANSPQTVSLTRPATTITPSSAATLARPGHGSPAQRPSLLLRQVRPAHQGWNPALALKEAGSFGFRIAHEAELAPAHAAAEAIMGMTLAPVRAIAAAHAQTGGTGWIHHTASQDGSAPDINGVILLLPLSEAGEADIRAGRFQPRAPEPHQLCAPGDDFPAIYFWLFAGRDGRARRDIIRTCLAWRNGAYAHVRGYARAASIDGFRTMAALGFESMPSSLSHLFFIDRRA